MPASDREAFAKQNAEVKEPFKLQDLHDQLHSKPGKLRVINVSAGVAGFLMAYKMQKNFTEYELTCYEKYSQLLSLGRFILTRLRNSEVGGTWYENRLVDPWNCPQRTSCL
jgi:hypothetical protein